jgi:hypothetical protein
MTLSIEIQPGREKEKIRNSISASVDRSRDRLTGIVSRADATWKQMARQDLLKNLSSVLWESFEFSQTS